MNALISITEINSLYDQRPIVEKQASYAFVHPWAEAFGGIVSDIPVKFVSAVVFNIIYYFLAGLVSVVILTVCHNNANCHSVMNPRSFLSSFFSHFLALSLCRQSSELWRHRQRLYPKQCPWPE
jgi:hypothetical protein